MRYLVVILFFYVTLNAQAYEPDSLYNKEVYEAIMRETHENILKHRTTFIELKLVDEDAKVLPHLPVAISLLKHKFLFGNITQPLVMQPENVSNPEKYKKRFEQFHNFAVIPFYWMFYEQKPGETMDKNYPSVLEWAQNSDIRLKGHPLAWGSRRHLPNWLFDMDAAKSEKLLLQRIEDITRKYKGQIDMWDVVNEPTHTAPWSRSMDTTRYHITDLSLDELIETINWVEKCFRAAYKGNPEGTFILNDYETIINPDNKTAFYFIVKELIRRNVPIHAIGIQAHNPKDCWFPPALFLSTLNLYSKLGLPIHITEFHPLSAGEPITGGWMKGKWNELSQAEFSEMMLKLAFSHPQVVSFTSWGLTDKFIWRDGAGFFNKEYAPKKVARLFNDYINNQWHFEDKLKSNEKGIIKMRAYYGKYQLNYKGKAITFTVENNTDRIIINIPE